MIDTSKLIAYWKNLNEREQWSLGLVSLIGLIYFFYLLVYAPLTNAVTNGAQQLQERQETLAWMQKIQPQLNHQTNKAAQVIDTSKLLSLIAAELSKPNFKAFTYQLQQTGSGDIQLSFEKVPYNVFMKWLWDITHQYVIHIKEMHIEPLPAPEKPGLVKFNLLITL